MLGLAEILHTLELGTDPKQMRKSLYGAYAWPAVATLGLSSSIYCDTKRGTKQLKDTQVGLTSFGALNIKMASFQTACLLNVCQSNLIQFIAHCWS